MHSGGESYGGWRGDVEGGLEDDECSICDDGEKNRKNVCRKNAFSAKNAESIILFF